MWLRWTMRHHAGINTPRSAFATPNAAVSRTETAEARRPSRYRPNQEARRGTREHRSEIGSRPTRSESFDLHSGRIRRRSSEDPTGRDFGFDRPQQLYNLEAVERLSKSNINE